jgi:hypothetical protein
LCHLADHGDDTEQVFAALQDLRLANTDEFITHDEIPLWHDFRNGDDIAVYAATRDNDAGPSARGIDAASDDENHERELPACLQGLNSVVPELHLQFGPPGRQCFIDGTVVVDNTRHRTLGNTLADSGAFNSCVTEAFATRAQARPVNVNLNSMPTLTMADGTRTRPKGLVQLQIQLTPSTSITAFAWLMPAGPFDFIMGSDVLTKYAGKIDYGEHVLRLQVNATAISLPFNLAPELQHEAARPVFATTTITIPAKHHALVPVNLALRERVPEGQWGYGFHGAGAQLRGSSTPKLAASG